MLLSRNPSFLPSPALLRTSEESRELIDKDQMRQAGRRVGGSSHRNQLIAAAESWEDFVRPWNHSTAGKTILRHRFLEKDFGIFGI